MGQATVDLPDPLEQPGAPAAGTVTAAADAASADDLLSQLAGDEIDRLLAEADAHEKAQDAASADASNAETPTPELTSAPAQADSDSAATAAQIDDILNHAEKATPPAQTVWAPGEATAVESTSVPVAVEVSSAPRVEDESEVAAAERAALTEPEPAPDPVEATRELVSVLSAESDDDRRVPLYLKPLEWLDAPLAACPESVRELLGKAAIITLANAIAVLVYVLIFRKH